MDPTPSVSGGRPSRLSPTSWLTTKTAFMQAFGLLLFAVQAPVLGPRAFGLVSIVMVFVGFCETVLCEAAAESLISIRRIDYGHFNAMNTANGLIAVLCGAIVFVGAPTYAQLFHDEQLVPILHWMSILPLLSALAAVPTAATKRDMQFQPLALRSMLSVFVGGIVGLILTLTGAGVWALVWQAIVTRLVAAIVLWCVVPVPFRLGLSMQRLGDLVTFALPTLLSRTMTWITVQIPRLLLGLYWGPAELGLFSLAARLTDVILEVTVVPRYAVARVELRRFADDAAGLQRATSELLRNMSVYCFPICMGGIAAAPTLFHAWLDPRWYGGIVPAQLMLLMCVAFTTHYCIGAALLALNQQKVEALTSVAQTVVTVAVVVVSAPLGLIPATAAYAGRPILLLPLPVTLLSWKGGVPASAVLRAQLPVLSIALVMGIIVWILRVSLEPFLNSVVLLGLLVVCGAVVYAALLLKFLPESAAPYRRFLRFLPSRELPAR
jgi:O-antigen/teichoic acid export membrane protein